MARAWVPVLIILLLVLVLLYFVNRRARQSAATQTSSGSKSKLLHDSLWRGPDSSSVPATEEGNLILYGRNLIAKTSYYFGPDGKISHSTNGMNCQNCHLEAGTKPWGNNYGGVYSTYPKFRERRGGNETIAQRIDDCFSRSLNGTAPDSNTLEMRAIMAYMKWLGAKVPKGTKPAGSGIQQLKFLDRPADSARGRKVYEEKCQRCHGPNGRGNFFPGTVTYQYPPLWGLHSYNKGAGLYRLSRFAGYVKNNMPNGTDYGSAQLTDEEAWDVAAFVNSRPRPSKPYQKDWPNIALKPFDHPFGPYADTFSQQQHKFGPFLPILKAKEELEKKKHENIH